MRDVFEVIGAMALVIGGIFAVFISLFALAYAIIDPPACRAYSAGSPIETRWSFWGGCQLKDGRGVWISPEQYRAVAVQ